jgi:hypothetical protein
VADDLARAVGIACDDGGAAGGAQA